MTSRTERTGIVAGPADAVRALSTSRTIIVCLALLLEGMSSSSINVQVHGIQAELGLGEAQLQLVVGAFLLAYAGFLPVAGRLADVASRRLVFRAGIVLFGLGCAACALATGGPMIIAGRLVQGLGAALSAPAALALITAGLGDGARRNRAVAIYGAMGAAGFSLGLALPGFVVAQLGWRASFLLMLPFVVVVLAATAGIATNAPAGGRVDVAGAALLTGALVTAVHAIGGVGSSPPAVLAAEAIGVAVLVGALVLRGGLSGYPAGLLRHPGIVAACVAIAATYAAAVSTMFVLSLGLQVREELDAFELGLFLVPQPLAFALTAGLGSRLVSRLGAARVLAIGGLLLGGSLAALVATGTSPSWVTAVPPAMAGVGASLGMLFPAASIAVVDAAPQAHRGSAAGVLTAAQNVGGALGVAIMSALAVVPAAGNGVGVRPGMAIGVVMVLAGGIVVATFLARARADA